MVTKYLDCAASVYAYVKQFFHKVNNAAYVHMTETESERQSERGSSTCFINNKDSRIFSGDCMCTTVASIQIHYTHNHARQKFNTIKLYL